MTIRIILVDDHTMFREGLKSIITANEDTEVVAEAPDGRTALKLILKHKPDVVIMDIGMPGMNGIDTTRCILAELPQLKIIGLSMHSQRTFIVKMLQAGVSAYLLKTCTARELLECIHVVHQGLSYLCPGITQTVLKELLDHSGSDSVESSSLSAREREVLQLIAEGKTSKTIAAHLNISIKTVESHRKNLMAKLDIYTVAGLTKYAVQEGLTSPEN